MDEDGWRRRFIARIASSSAAGEIRGRCTLSPSGKDAIWMGEKRADGGGGAKYCGSCVDMVITGIVALIGGNIGDGGGGESSALTIGAAAGVSSSPKAAPKSAAPIEAATSSGCPELTGASEDRTRTVSLVSSWSQKSSSSGATSESSMPPPSFLA